MKPKNEASRIKYLEKTQLLNKNKEEQFEDIVLIAKSISGMPAALITLIGPEAQWTKATTGTFGDQTPRNVSFCTHVVYLAEELYIPDAKTHPEFKENPFVLDGTIGFYTGFPISTKEGYTLGSLCIIDSKPNTLSEEKKRQLRALCRILVDVIEYRTDFSKVTTKNKQRINNLRNTLSIILTATESGTLDPELVLEKISNIREELVNWEASLSQKFGRDNIESVNVIDELKSALERYALFAKGDQLEIQIIKEEQNELFFNVNLESFQHATSTLCFKLITEGSLELVKLERQKDAVLLHLPIDFLDKRGESLINTIKPMMKKSHIDLSREGSSFKLRELL